MANLRFTGLLALCTMLAACDSTTPSRNVTEPQLGAPSFDLGASGGIGTTAQGPFDEVLATEDPSAQEAATGARATGHVGFDFSTPVLGIASEEYSFVALSTEPPPPFAAKGQYQLQLVTSGLSEQKVHGEVICLSVVGNRARIGGRITRASINNVPFPTNLYNFWTVQDNGEGQDPPDMASLMRFTNEAVARAHCSVGFVLENLPIREGNVQVSSK